MNRPRILAFTALAALLVLALASLLKPPHAPQAVGAPGSDVRNASALLHAPVPPHAARRAAASVAGRAAESTRILSSPERRSEAELRSAALERRSSLRELIQADPAAALACRLTYAQRRALPDSVAKLLEKQVDAFGRLEVMALCGPQAAGVERFVTVSGVRRQAFMAGARVQAVSQDRMPVHGIAVDDVMAIASDPYRMPDPGEPISVVVSAVTGVEVLVGDEARAFVAKPELDEWAEKTRAAESALPSVFGIRKILFVMVDFSDAPGAPVTEAEIRKSMDAVNAYYSEVSASRLSFVTSVLPSPLRAPQSKTAYSQDSESYARLLTDAMSALRDYEVLDGNRGNYAQANFQHVAVVFGKVPGYAGWAGRADSLGSRLLLNGYWSAGVIAHEIGHNFGLSHAHSWRPSGSSAIGSGAHVEYGDIFDVMGMDGSESLRNVQICVPRKLALGLVNDSNLISVRSSGEFRIYRHDADVGRKVIGLKIDAGSAYDYWVEYRKLPPIGVEGYSDAMAAGVQLRWNKLPDFTKPGATGTYLLDMTPGTLGDMKDSMLTLGSSFIDANYKIRITPLKVGSSADGDWIDVSVVLGDAPGNRAPVIQSIAATESGFARVPVSISARGVDADGDAVLYRWDFGDGGRVFSTESTIQKSWSAGGSYSVSVTAFDIYGGESRGSYTLAIQDPLDLWTRVTVPGLTETLGSVCFARDRFVAVGDYASATSQDGKQWSRSTSGITSFRATAIAAGEYFFLSAGQWYDSSTGTFFTAFSRTGDGSSWSTNRYNATDFISGMTYGAGRFVAVGQKGVVWSSSDGIAWQRSFLGAGRDLSDVRFANGNFLAVGSLGAAFTSTDGVYWRDISLSSMNTTSPVAGFQNTSGVGVAYLGGRWISSTLSGSGDSSGRVFWINNAFDGAGRWTVVNAQYYASTYVPNRIGVVAGGTLALLMPVHDSQPKIRLSADGLVWTEKVVGPVSSGSLWDCAEGKGRIVLVGENGQIYVSSDGSPAIARQPQGQVVAIGSSASLSVAAYATGPFGYQWMRNGVGIPGGTADTFTISSASVGDSGIYTVAVTNSRGVTVSAAAALTVRPPVSAPIILAGPSSRIITQGTTTQLSVSASGTPAPTYQWVKDGVPIPGATGASFSLTADGSASGGVFTVEVTNSVGRVTTSAASIRVIPTNRLANLSVRTAMEAGQNLIVGAVMAEGSKGVLLRAAGPALNLFGLAGLPDPSIDLYTGGSRPAASNDDWSASIAPLFQSVGAFGFVVGSKDAAMNPTIGGAFTVQVKGAGSGTVLVEAYDLGAGTTPRLVNLSARHWVGTGADVLIAGFVLAGTGSKQVLIRAVGPTLASFGVDGTLSDPQLEVLDSSGGTLGSNDNWPSSLSPTFTKVGAFPLVAGSRDAAALVTLTAGASYTVKVSGVNNTTGEALIEIYEVF